MNILLIHGWNYNNYYGRTTTKAWNNRQKFISELSKYHKVFRPDLPGFGLTKEPKTKGWTLDDYAKFINDYITENNLDIDCIIGYSFGGAVAVKYKKIYSPNIKEILISPALIRNNKKSKEFIKTPEYLNFIRNFLRNFYLIHVTKTEEMVYGTKFLRNTYQSIVRENMLPEISDMVADDFCIIYGENDNMVNPKKVIETVPKELKKQIHLISQGGHDIANTHTEELVELINGFVLEKKVNYGRK